MEAARWKQIKDVFNTVVELNTDERQKFLSENCNGDKDLRCEVERLLASDEPAEIAFEVSAFKLLTPDDYYVGKTVGKYKIEREIGRGGMGAVYLAVREDLGKQFALKIIKRGMDSEEMLRRFRHEREILAALEHPNIAGLLDGGATDDGLPYFVMDYVEGEDLLTFCNRRKLSINERLALFRKICSAVKYAHSRLVVHRDLKPSNILVTDDGEPKLLDFGISKLLTSDAPEHTGTATALGMMTPNYSSPEQFRGETVTTATDVYSLGVILYEMLTGDLPYKFTSRRFDEMSRIVCEEIPIAPSSAENARRKTEANQTRNQAAQTKINAPQTAFHLPFERNALRGDIDTIVLKALRKEIERRYSSVEQFSEDLRRHLAGLPIKARPDTFSYRATKFFGRNRIAVVSAALIFLVLVGGIATTVWQTVRAERQRDLAERRFAEVRGLARNVIFKYHDEIRNLPGATKVREMLVTDALEYLDRLSADDAQTDDTLKHELAQAYMRVGDIQGEPYQANVGDTAGAIRSYQKAAALLESIKQKSPDIEIQREIRRTQQQLGILAFRAGNGGGRDFVTKAIALSEQILNEDAANTDDKLSLVQSLIYLGDNSQCGLENGESVSVYQKALAIVEPIAQSETNNATAVHRLASVTQRIGFHYWMLAKRAANIERNDRAIEFYRNAAQFYRRSVEAAARLVALEPRNALYGRIGAMSRYNEATVQLELGADGEALETFQKVLRDRTAAISNDLENVEALADLPGVNYNMASIYRKRKNYQLAAKYTDIALSHLDEIVNRDTTNNEFREGRFNTQLTYADILIEKGETDEAVKVYQKAFEQMKDSPVAGNTAKMNGFASLTHEKLGDAHRINGVNVALTASQRRASLQTASAEYQSALDALPTLSDSVYTFGEEKRQFISRKLSQCKEKLAAL